MVPGRRFCASRVSIMVLALNSNWHKGELRLCMSLNNLWMIIRKAEVLLLKLSQITQKEPLFVIVHRFGYENGCYPGEQIGPIYCLDEAPDEPLPFTSGIEVFMDYMARYRH